MDTEKPLDFQSKRDIFQSGGRANTLPAATKNQEEFPNSKICNIRRNPAFQDVIENLEKQSNPTIAGKPALPAKPIGPSRDTFSSNTDMRKRLQTFYVTDPKRTDGNGVCANSPQVYRHSMPNFPDPPPEVNQIYQDVDTVLPPAPTIADIHFPPPPPIGPKPAFKITNVANDKRKEYVPPLKPLPPVANQGPPPPKPPRPPNVDLGAFFPGALQQNEIYYNPVETIESTDTEYEQPPSPPPMSPDIYDEAYSQAESDPNAYVMNDVVEYDAPDAMNLVPEAVQPTPEDSSLYESESMACYEDIVKIRDSVYSSNFYDTEEPNPMSSLEATNGYTDEVSVDDDVSYSSTMGSSKSSSASEGNYSASLDTSSGFFGSKESKSKEVKLGKEEQAFRKKYKITGQEQMLYTSKIIDDFKSEKYSLPVKRGDTVEVIRITDCLPGKWLSRDAHGKYGFVPVACLQVSNEIQNITAPYTSTIPADQSTYCDIEVGRKNSGANADTMKGSDGYSGGSDGQYDDVSPTNQTLNNSGGKGKGFGLFFRKDKSKKEDQVYSPALPNLNRTTSHDQEDHTYDFTDEHEREKEEKSPRWKAIFHKNKEQKVSERKFSAPSTGVKPFAKEEKVFREKFKYTGEINVLNIATINDLAPLSPKDKLDLAVKPGETVEVIDVTNEDQIICRNFAGKYGYLRIDCLNFKIEDYE